MTPEGRVKEKVKRLLDRYDDMYRFMPVQSGYGAPSLDFLLCFRGLFIAVETKTPGKDLTPRQRATRVLIEEAGGKVFVVRDDSDIFLLAAHLNMIERTVSV